MTRISPLRKGETTGVVVGATDMSAPVSDNTGLGFPLYASVSLPISPTYGPDLPMWAIKHCLTALRDLKVWADGVWYAEPREVDRYRAENGDTWTWWAATIGPKTKKQAFSGRR